MWESSAKRTTDFSMREPDPVNRQTEQATVIKDILTGIVASIAIFLITLYVPLLGFFVALILPMPIMFYRLKLGRNPGVFIMGAAFGVISVVTGTFNVDMLFYGALLLTGFFLGEFIEMHLSVEKTGAYTCLSTIGLCTALFFLYSAMTGQSVFQILTDYVAVNLEMTLKLYAGMGLPQENIDILSNSIDTIQFVLVRILPAIVITMLLIVTWINILLIRTVLSKKGIRMVQLELLNRWRAPEQLVWLVILFGLLLMAPSRAVKITGLNCIIVFMPIYFFQGIAIVSFFFEKKGFPNLLRVFIYGIIAVQQLFLFLVVGLGFFDTWIDFRKVAEKNTTDGNQT